VEIGTRVEDYLMEIFLKLDASGRLLDAKGDAGRSKVD
jgi:hypothetical protein